MYKLLHRNIDRGAAPNSAERIVKTKFGKKLQSPLALTFQGFLAGALLFFTIHPLAVTESAAPPPAGPSVLADLGA